MATTKTGKGKPKSTKARKRGKRKKPSVPNTKLIVSAPEEIHVELVPKSQQPIPRIFEYIFAICLTLTGCILGVVLTKPDPTWFEFVSLGITGLATVVSLGAVLYSRKRGGT